MPEDNDTPPSSGLVSTDTEMGGVQRSNQPEEGIVLCLSGGGYRAMLFHIGAITRLNEMALLKQLKRISSVSGGSITAAVLGLNWHQLIFDQAGRATNLNEWFLQPLQRMARTTIDRGSVIGGVLFPGSISDRITSHYQDVLFGDATLQDLPNDSNGPRFVINATGVQTGSLVRFSKPYAADYRVGVIRNPTILLATVVAASSAFPPFLSPAELDVDPSDFDPDPNCDLQREPYTDTMVLTDGGVYDNLGLETAWKRFTTVLVSDGGGKMMPDGEPAGDWAQHSKRVLDIVDNQVRSLRKRQLIGSFISGERDGAYWGIRTDVANYQLDDSLPVSIDETLRLAATPTRLKKLSSTRQQQLINWGYAVCDAAMRKHASVHIAHDSPPAEFPFDVDFS